MNRKNVLVSAAAVFLLVAVIRFFWPDGTISIDFTNAPLSKVAKAIEQKGNIDIVTNVPPETPVTIRLVRATLMDALDTLAVRIDADLRPAIIVAPNRETLNEGLALFQTPSRPKGWKLSSVGGGGDFLQFSASPFDPRTLPVEFEVTEPNDFHSALRQVSIKSGLLTAVPDHWNPPIIKAPSPATASQMIAALTKSTDGISHEVFLLLADRAPQNRADRPNRDGDGPRENANPQWIAARAQAAIAQLPPEDRPAAQADFEAMRTLWAEVSSLPEDQRREKMAEIFSRPEVQERIEERIAARDAKRTPEQREQRMKNYIERKKQAQAANAQPQ